MALRDFLPREGSTPLWDPEQIDEIVALFDERYRNELQDEGFELEGCLYEGQMHVRVTLQRLDGTMRYPVECLCSDMPATTPEVRELALRLIDYVDAYWYNYFQGDRRVYLTLDWSPHKTAKDTFYLRGEIRYPHLEAQADEFLKAHGVEL